MKTTTIIVVAVLTLIIFGLAILALRTWYKSEKQIVKSGEHDAEIRELKAYEQTKKAKAINIANKVITLTIASLILAAATTAIVYRAGDNQFTANGKTSLVIASDSMDGFHNEDYQKKVLEWKADAADDQFAVGDILTFKTVNDEDDIQLYQVYGYENIKGKIITHRCIGVADDGRFIFRGDNAPGCDSFVKRSQIKFQYTGSKIEYIGRFVLFAKSGFGMYSLISVIGVIVITEAFTAAYNKMLNKRYIELGKEQPVLETASSQELPNIIVPQPEVNLPRGAAVLAEFDRRDTTHVIIYKKSKKRKHQ